MATKTKPADKPDFDLLGATGEDETVVNATGEIGPATGKNPVAYVRALKNWHCEMGSLTERRAYSLKAASKKKPGYDELNTPDNPQGQIYAIPLTDKAGNEINDLEKLTDEEYPVVMVVHFKGKK